MYVRGDVGTVITIKIQIQEVQEKATGRKAVNSDLNNTTNSDHGVNVTSYHYRENDDNKTTTWNNDMASGAA